ncbi:threonine/serine exporter family protein [Macrococcus equipercicus]|uniref:Threonine/serine exporter family protein n=1 Tax=Macrococcus equipercicus TaxID=69967 RepID=A0A9Q9BUG7_9STAP|nr:threonine/serine exporter family protein [Macrococcus equipercicus]UTH14331.1 threonine/serine exporter family protein [Macrococcus equipercicus]
MTSNDINKTIDVIMIAGKILLENGAETYRVEDTMTRIAAHYGLNNTHSFVVPTAIIFSLSDKSETRLMRIDTRTTDLEKIANTNEISRAIAADTMTLDMAKAALHELDQANLQYPLWLKVLSAGIVSFFFLFMFGGTAVDALPAFLAGSISFLIAEYIQLHTRIKFFSEFAAAIIIALIAQLFVLQLGGGSINKIIIAGVMPLVPGVLITNAIRDLMASHLQAGIVKGVEAGLTAFAIGAGVALCLTIF